MKKIGILGGLGPSITAKLYLDIVNDKRFEIYPNIIISNVSFPKGLDKKIIQNKENVELMAKPLMNSMRQLKNAKVDMIVLPCNTLENLTFRINKKLKMKLLTPATETSKELSRLKVKKIGLIATSKTKELKIYEKMLKNIQIEYPSAKEQSKISNIINGIIFDKINSNDKKFLKNLVKKFLSQGCDKVVLGCTDLSNIRLDFPQIIDSFKILSKKVKSILLNQSPRITLR